MTPLHNSLKQRLLLSLALGLPFIVLCVMGIVDSQLLHSFDTVVSNLFYNRGSEPFTRLIITFTTFGNPKSVILIVIVVVLLLLIIKRDWKSAIWYALTVFLGADILNNLVKDFFQRVRPGVTHLVEQGGYSFPSGHAMGAVIYFGAIAYLGYYFAVDKSSQLKYSLIALTIVFALLMGLSRIYLGVHYPSDVLGGYSLGSAFLILAITLHRHWLQTNTPSKF